MTESEDGSNSVGGLGQSSGRQSPKQGISQIKRQWQIPRPNLYPNAEEKNY